MRDLKSRRGTAHLDRNRARNGNFGTGDQGSKLPHLRERRPGSVRAETKNPANSGPFSTVSAKRQNSKDAGSGSSPKVGIAAAYAVPASRPARVPGTEFLDAETERQKPPPKGTNARRDKNRGIEWQKSPQKRPIWRRLRIMRFARAGWWWTQSVANRSLHRKSLFWDQNSEISKKISGPDRQKTQLAKRF